MARFGDPKKRRVKTKTKLEAIIRDDKYMKFLEKISNRIAFKYNVFAEDILQDYFLSLASGHNSLIEQTAMETVRKEFNRGIVGKRVAGNIISSLDMDELKKFKQNEKDEIKRVEYLHDIRSQLNDEQWKIAALFLFGFNAREIIEKGIPRRQVYKISSLF